VTGAGHSLGGIHALTYAAGFPHDVAGVVLLDSASPHQVDLVATFNGEYQVARRALAVAPILFRFGVGHLIQAIATPALPGAVGEQAAVFASSPRGMRNERAEQRTLPEAFRQAQALTTLGATPLVVLTAKDNVDHKPGWATAQDQLAALSTNSRHTVADLDHMALLEDPAGSAQSVQAIADVVVSARTHSTQFLRPDRSGPRPLATAPPDVNGRTLHAHPQPPSPALRCFRRPGRADPGRTCRRRRPRHRHAGEHPGP
jgi:pimeloyl-ACP methyl ester carboxylesterase